MHNVFSSTEYLWLKNLQKFDQYLFIPQVFTRFVTNVNWIRFKIYVIKLIKLRII